MRTALLAAALLSIGFAPVPFPKADRSGSGVTTIQGKWEVIEVVDEGKRQSVEPGVLRAVIAETKLTFYFFGRKEGEWEIAVRSKGRASEMDMRQGGWQKRGIWAVRGDTLTFCCRKSDPGEPEPVRPTRFEETDRVWRYTFKRVKPSLR